MHSTPEIEKIKKYNNGNFFLLAGPCVVENEEMPLEIATHINTIVQKLGIPYIFKASYRKANRSKSSSFSGIGDIKALEAIARVGKTLGIPTVTDIHSAAEAALAAEYVDVLQIPAFLCRQTDLLEAAAKTGKWVNIKKGQFLSPESMKFAVEKVQEAGNNKVMLTDRGTMFGYQDMIVDMRGIPTMQSLGTPVILDITHSLQQPNQPGGVSGGNPAMISTIGRSGIAAGCDGIFLETHPNPAIAKSDGANMLAMHLLEKLLSDLVIMRQAFLKTVNG